MAWSATDFLEDSKWEASDFEEPDSEKIARSGKAIGELGRAIEEHKAERSADKLSGRDLTPLERLRGSELGRRLLPRTQVERELGSGQITPGDIARDVLKFTTLPPQIANPIREITEAQIAPIAESNPIAAGVARGAREIAIGALGNVPASGLMGAGRVLGTPFSLDYAASLPEQVETMERAASTGDRLALAESAASALGGAATIGLGALGSVRPGRLAGVGAFERPAIAETVRNIEPAALKPERIAPAEVVPAPEPVVVPEPVAPVPERAVLPEAKALADKYKESIPELEKLSAEASAAAAKATADYEAGKTSMKREERLKALPRLQELGLKGQAHAEALQLLEDRGLRKPSEIKAPETQAEAGPEALKASETVREEAEHILPVSGLNRNYVEAAKSGATPLTRQQFEAKYQGMPKSALDRLWAKEQAKSAPDLSARPLTLSEIAQGKSRGAEAGFVDVQPIIDAVYSGAQKTAQLLRARGGLPKEAYAAKEKAAGAIQSADKTVKFLSRDLMRALGNAYGLNKIEMAAGGSRKIPVADVQRMDAYLKGDVSVAEQIQPAVRGALDNQRAAITGLSEKIISELESQGGNEKLIDTIKNNMDVYVTRSYKFFDSKAPADKWYNDLPFEVRQRAEQFVQQPRPDGSVPTQSEAQSQLLNWLSDLKQDPQRAAGSVGPKDLSQFMKRKSIAPEIRAVLGEYKDPMINFARSVTKMSDWLANQQFLSDVKKAGEGQWLFKEADAPPGFNAQIAGEGSEAFSPLNGMRTTPEIAQALQEIRGRTSDPGAIAKTYLTINALTKQASTTQSLLTQMRNLTSQPWFWGMNGHWKLGEIQPTLKAIAQDLGVSANSQRWRDYLKEAADRGIVGDTARATELLEIINDAALNDVNPSELSSYSMAKLAKKAYFKFPAEIYKLSDELGKIYGWENEKAIVRQVHPEWSQEQVATEAATRVRNQYPTYSKIPEALKQLRKVPVVGPFVSFPYEIMRTSYHAMGQSISELRSANPVERTIGAKRAASQIATLGAGYGLAALSKSIWGVTDKQEEDLRRFQPSWSKNSQFLYLGKDKGELKYMNLSYQNPYSYLVDPVISVTSSIQSDEPFLSATARSAAEFFRPFVSEQMLANALLDVSRNTTETGRQVYNPQDELGIKATKIADHIGMTLAPGTVQRARKRIIPSFNATQQPEFGRKLSPEVELAAEFSGMRLEQFDFKNGLAFKARKFGKNLQDAEGVFRSTVNQSGTDTPGLLDAFERSQKARKGLWDELRGDYLAALRNGVDVDEADKTLDAMGLSRQMAESVSSGLYEPWLPSEDLLKRIEQRGRQVPFNELRDIYQKYRTPNAQ